MSRSVPIRQHAVKSKSAAAPRTPEGDAFSALIVQVFQLNGRLIAIGDALAAPAHQTSARWQVLAAVEGEPRSVANIARLLGLARQSVQRIADLLEKDGLARYGENPNHLRAKLLELTDAGRSTLASIAGAQRTWANRVGAELGLSVLRRTSSSLARIVELLAEGAALED
jgi:DNA-binding MarR family transcriptional regulator